MLQAGVERSGMASITEASSAAGPPASATDFRQARQRLYAVPDMVLSQAAKLAAPDMERGWESALALAAGMLARRGMGP